VVDGGGRAFAGRAALYARYRREYPAEFIRRLRQFSRGGHGRLLDLGCGTGQLLLPLAAFFDEAVGIDPEPDMLREAERAARERKVSNAHWIEAGSRDLEELEPALGCFDLVTVGTAFHFMEPRTTLAALQRIGGGVAVAYAGSPMWLHPDPWAKALRGVLEARLGPLRGFDFTEEALSVCEATMHDLGYFGIERWEQTYEETMPASRCFPRCATRSDRQLREGAVPLTSVQTRMVEPNDDHRPRAKMGGSAWGTRGRTYGHCSRFPSARRRVAAVSLSRKSREATPSQATRHVEPYRTLARGTRLSGAGLVCSGSHPAIAERRTLNSRGAVDSWAWAPLSPFGSTAATNTEGS
jgi:SAM-dependent methyltransferase